MSKLITVFGATGLQGGSVIRAIQADVQLAKEFAIRGVTRNAESPAAQKLQESGVEIANQDDPQTLAAAVQGSHTVFIVTQFAETFSFEKELQQGKNVADACQAAAVQHLIFSSLTDITAASQERFTKVYHFDAKAHIEQYIRASGIPATFVNAGSYMQNFFHIIRKAGNGSGGDSYALTLPIDDKARFPLIDVARDYGKFVLIALKQRDQHLGQTIFAAERYYAPSEIVQTYAQVLGRETRFVTVSPADFVKVAQPREMAEDLTEMLQAFAWPGYYAGQELDRTVIGMEGAEICDWKTFLERNREAF